MTSNSFRTATDEDLKMPEFKGKAAHEFEVTLDGKVLPKRRWEHALRQVALHLDLPSASTGEAQEILRDFYRLASQGSSPRRTLNPDMTSRYPACDDGSDAD